MNRYFYTYIYIYTKQKIIINLNALILSEYSSLRTFRQQKAQDYILQHKCIREEAILKL